MEAALTFTGGSGLGAGGGDAPHPALARRAATAAQVRTVTERILTVTSVQVEEARPEPPWPPPASLRRSPPGCRPSCGPAARLRPRIRGSRRRPGSPPGLVCG